MKQYYVYILASRRNGTLYTGMTENLAWRVSQHKAKTYSSFTQKYDVNQLVYYEVYDDPSTAIRREKNIKAWTRHWKLQLIEKVNSQWDDLSSSLLD